jgi:hypothetical protein
MSSIVPFAGGKLPAYLTNRVKGISAINSDIVTHQSYPVLSIKGKVFTLVKGKEKKVLMREDDAEEVRQTLNLTVIRANTKSRVFYAKAYSEGAEGEDARPDCYSADSVAPGADAKAPQAKKCQLCPHAVWGTGNNGVGTSCSVNTRLAVVDADSVMQGEVEPYLLRVPAGSRANFADVVKTADSRGIDYNMLALKVGFDKEAPSPKLTFKLVGLLDDDAYAKVNALYSDETVLDIVGLAPVRAKREEPLALAAPSVSEDDLDAALAARAQTKQAQAEAAAKAAVTKAATKPAAAAPKAEASMDDLDALMGEAVAVAEAAVAPPAKPKAAAKPKPAAPAPAADDDLSGLMDDLDGLLGSTDD